MTEISNSTFQNQVWIEANPSHIATPLSLVANVLNEVSKLFAKEMLASGNKPLIISQVPYMALACMPATNIFGDISVRVWKQKSINKF